MKTTDQRYTVQQEECGYAEPMYVARYMGRYIGCAYKQSEADDIVQAHEAARLDMLDDELRQLWEYTSVEG